MGLVHELPDVLVEELLDHREVGRAPVFVSLTQLGYLVLLLFNLVLLFGLFALQMLQSQLGLDVLVLQFGDGNVLVIDFGLELLELVFKD